LVPCTCGTSFFLCATAAFTLLTVDGFWLLDIARHGAVASTAPKTAGLDGNCWWKVSGGGGGQCCCEKAAGPAETATWGFAAAAETGALGFAAAEWDVEAAVVGLETPLPHASLFLGGTIASTLSKTDGFSFHFHTVRAAGTITPKTLGLGGPCWWEVSRGGQCCAEKATCAAETSESGVAVAAEWEVEAVVVGLETGASGVTTTAERVASGFAAAADWEVEALVVRLETGASGLAAAAEWEVESAVAGIETPLPHASFFLGATVASTLAKADGFSLLHIARHGAAATTTPKTVGLDGFCW
jgi:hypothetical protein